MRYVGVDLHKKTITVCAMVKEDAQRKVVCRKRFYCQDVPAIREFFEQLGPFQVTVEATDPDLDAVLAASCRPTLG